MRARSPWAGVLALAGLSVVFAANHVAARVAFDHGASVSTAVVVRAAGTALAVAVLLRLTGVALALPTASAGRAIAIGLVLALQSFCVYSAVARIPVALALLTYNSFPILLALLSWATGGERPTRRTVIALPVILAGLALALDVPGVLGSSGGPPGAGRPGDGATGQAVTGGTGAGAGYAAGVGFALAASAAFALALLLTTRWLGAVDGRLRTMWTMATVAVAVGAAAAAGGGFAAPADATGWGALVLLTVLFCLAFTTLLVVLPRMGAVNNSAVLNIEPLASMALAWAILDQRIAPLQVGGALVVVGAILWMSAGRR